jgi:hypothetical protein
MARASKNTSTPEVGQAVGLAAGHVVGPMGGQLECLSWPRGPAGTEEPWHLRNVGLGPTGPPLVKYHPHVLLRYDVTLEEGSMWECKRGCWWLQSVNDKLEHLVMVGQERWQSQNSRKRGLLCRIPNYCRTSPTPPMSLHIDLRRG